MGRGESDHDQDFPVLDKTERARWGAVTDHVDEAAAALSEGDAEGAEAALSAVKQVGGQLEPQRLLNSLHVPDDAGEYRDAIVRMLQRIPDGWGRWIGCGAGWYPLIVKLGQDLAEIDPAYEINQVKEKFGTLRFYFELSSSARLKPDAQDRAQGLVAAAERASTEICEQCSQPGRLMKSPGHWYKTLCDGCAGDRYVPID